MKHLLGIRELRQDQLQSLLAQAISFKEIASRELKKVPALRGKTVVNLFLEPSTRTRTSFEIAGKWLSADVINIGGNESSAKKGETLRDTVCTLQAMSPDILVIRHRESGAAAYVARILGRTSVINAGDGTNEHPTQALLDLVTLTEALAKRKLGLTGLKVAIVGDVRHSRVARSNIWAHLLLGNEIRLVGPPTLVPADFSGMPEYSPHRHPNSRLSIYHDLAAGVEGCDVVICLRMQLERQDEHFVPSLEQYTLKYCLTETLLAKYAPNAVVMHPGPVNRGVEISSGVIDGPRSLIEKQVANGVAVRMAVLFSLATASSDAESGMLTPDSSVGDAKTSEGTGRTNASRKETQAA